MSKSFTFFESFAESARMMTDTDRLAFYDAVVNCAIYGEDMSDLPPAAHLVFTAIKPILEANVRDRDNGGKGGRPRKENPSENPLKNPLENPTPKPKVKYSIVDVKYSKVKESKVDNKVASAPSPQRFQKPSIDEIKAFCKERHNSVDAEAFWSFYESNGWKVGKNPMKSWKNAVITWEKRNNNGNDKRNNTSFEERNLVCNDWTGEFSTL